MPSQSRTIWTCAPSLAPTVNGSTFFRVCDAVCAPGASRWYELLDVPQVQSERLPTVAAIFVESKRDFVVVRDRLESSAPFRAIADNLTGADIGIVDSLLHLATRYIADDAKLRNETLWTRHVLPRLSDLKTSSELSENVVSALLQAYAAYELRLRVVGEIFSTTNWEDMAKGTADMRLDDVANMVGRKSFILLTERFQSVLDSSELRFLLNWASALAETRVTLG